MLLGKKCASVKIKSRSTKGRCHGSLRFVFLEILKASFDGGIFRLDFPLSVTEESVGRANSHSCLAFSLN